MNRRISRTTSVLKLSAALLASIVFSLNQEVSGGYLQLFKNEVAIQALREFMGFSVTASACPEQI